MATPPTFVLEHETANWNTSTTPKPFGGGAFTPGNGNILVGMCAKEATTGALGVSGGPTWTTQLSLNAASECPLLCVTAVGAGSSITANVTLSTGANHFGGNCLEFSGSDGIGNVAGAQAKAGTHVTQTITTLQDNSAIVVIFADFTATTHAAHTWDTLNGVAPSAGNGFELSDYVTIATDYGILVAYYPDAGAAGAKTVGVTLGGTVEASMIAIEIKGAAGAGAPGDSGPQPMPMFLPTLTTNPLQGVIFPYRPWQRRFQWATQPWLNSDDASHVFQQALSGSTTPTSALTKLTTKQLGGASTPTSLLTRLVGKLLAGASTPVGVLTLVRLVAISLVGSTTPNGLLTRLTNKLLGGTSTPSGLLTRLTGKTLPGSTTPTSALTKFVSKTLAGIIGGSTPSLVKQTTGSAVAGLTASPSVTSTGGNMLLAFVTRGTGLATGAITTFTDSAGNTWTMLTRGAVSGATHSRIELWVAPNAAAITGISLASATSSTWAWNIIEVSGAAAASVLDVASTDGSGNASATSQPTPSITTTIDNDLILAGWHFAQTTSSGLTAGWTALTDYDDAAVGSGRAAYRVSPAGSYSATLTLGVAKATGVITAAVKPGGSGALTGTLTVLKIAIKALTGSTTPNGALAKQANKQLGGASTPISVLTRLTSKLLAASTTPSGALATVRLVALTFTGASTPAGLLQKLAGKKLAASSTPAGAISKQANKALTASTTPTSTLTTVKAVLRALAGSTTPTGVLTRFTSKKLAGSTAPSSTLSRVLSAARTFTATLPLNGSLAKLAVKALAASTTPSGALATARFAIKALAGSITPTGVKTLLVGKALAGSSTLTGAITRLTSKKLTASTTPTSTLATVKAVIRSFTGATTPTGLLTKLISKPLAGTSTPAGALAKLIGKLLTASITPNGALTRLRQLFRAFAGSTTPSGVLRRLTSKPFAGSTTPTGTILKTIKITLGGVLGLAGDLAAVLNPNQNPVSFRIRRHGREGRNAAGREGATFLHGREARTVAGQEGVDGVSGRRDGLSSGQEDGN